MHLKGGRVIEVEVRPDKGVREAIHEFMSNMAVVNGTVSSVEVTDINNVRFAFFAVNLDYVEGPLDEEWPT